MCAATITATGWLRAGQEEFYVREEIPLPKGEVMELGSIALLPEQKIAVSSRRGDVWICEGAYGDDLSQVTWTRFARNLHEPLGMFFKDGWLYATQRPELTRMRDTDGDGRADQFETLSSAWGIKGDYHEYAFGSEPDRNGDVWIALCLTGSFTAEADWRGWALRITPEGEMIPTCSGVRSPGGIGMNAEGDMFYTDNQGPWNGSSSLKWLRPGSFQGNPMGNKFHDLANLPDPPEPTDESRMISERKKFPELVPPAVILPHARLGQSPSGFAYDATGGKFGPWENQLYVGEQTFSQLQRVFLEKVNGFYQGAAFPFLEGFEAGLVPVRQAEDGTVFIGGTNRGWGSRGSKPFTFERVRWTGRVPFEIREMRVTRDGFDLVFTQPVDPITAGDPASYEMSTWTYVYQAQYGSPEVDQTTPSITSATVSADGLGVSLEIDGRVQGHVHYLQSVGVRAADAATPLWHADAYYTLNEIPE